jgi:hypothetical protein
MLFNGNEGEFITLEEGAAMTARYRNTINPGEPLGFLSSKSIFDRIFNQTGCEGIRIYFGINESGKQNLVVVGTDSAGNDLASGLIADSFGACPPVCSSSNPLNS